MRKSFLVKYAFLCLQGSPSCEMGKNEILRMNDPDHILRYFRKT